MEFSTPSSYSVQGSVFQVTPMSPLN